MKNWNDIQRQGLAMHNSLERVLNAKHSWRAIARALGFTKRGVHMLAKAKRNGYVFVDMDSGMQIDGRVDYFVRWP